MKKATTLLLAIYLFASCTKTDQASLYKPAPIYVVTITNTAFESILDSVIWNGQSAFPPGAFLPPSNYARVLDTVNMYATGNSVRCVLNSGGFNYGGGGDRLQVSTSDGEMLLDTLIPNWVPFDYTVTGIARANINVNVVSQ